MLKLKLTTLLLVASFISVMAQSERWQQKAKYEMNIDVKAKKHQFKGTQKLTYWNNSHDELTKVFYHLYINDFKTGLMLD